MPWTPGNTLSPEVVHKVFPVYPQLIHNITPDGADLITGPVEADVPPGKGRIFTQLPGG
jgi:hypothetical protein